MDNEDNQPETQRLGATELHILSGGVGASGELLAHTVLAQFPGASIPIVVHPHVHTQEEVVDAVDATAKANGLLLHTMVNAELRQFAVGEAARRDVDAIDLFGPLMDYLSERMDVTPVGQAGRYRQLYDQYFKRVEAIEFTIDHDDGKRTTDLSEADIILIGVSRLGKTPLSMYLAMQGWKVANVPYIPQVNLPDELWSLDRRRVIGLMIEPPQLAVHRQWRQKRLKIPLDDYVGRQQVAQELRDANHFYDRYNISVVDVTNKPIETSGTEVITVVTRQLNSQPLMTLGND